MADLLRRPQAPGAQGIRHDVSPADAGWNYVGFRLHSLAAGQTASAGSHDREALLVFLSGRGNAQVDGQSFGDLGGRTSPFDAVPPDAVYVPAGSQYTVTARDSLELAVCSAPGQAGARGAYALDGARDIAMFERGEGTNTRYIRNILPDTAEDAADSLIVVEVITPAGYWSSYPPHKHDTDNLPHESYLEETYYHRLTPGNGFAFQRVYTDDGGLDQSMAVQDGDVVLVPRGYHPCGAPHGYTLHYLNVMAGPKRTWKFTTQPEFRWLVT